MRDKIKEVGCDLLIVHGFQGLRFGDIAERLKITRANIHYHFGTKSKLVDEVLAEYLDATIKQMGSVWRSDLSYEEKVVATMELNRRRYLRFNKSDENGGAPWSLISRMRLEANLLSKGARARLREFSGRMERFVAEAIDKAQANGEIAADAPVSDIAVQIVSIIDSAGPITQDAGSFARLEHLYLAHMRVIAHAYVSQRKPKSVHQRLLTEAAND
jgi:TetR/AcrR family transcriptional repressor of nem operon